MPGKKGIKSIPKDVFNTISNLLIGLLSKQPDVNDPEYQMGVKPQTLPEKIQERLDDEERHAFSRGADEGAMEFIRLNDALKAATASGDDAQAEALRTRLKLLIGNKRVREF
jgi:hypothetical protein